MSRGPAGTRRRGGGLTGRPPPPPPPRLDLLLPRRDFCAYTGHRYGVGLNSCGVAIFLALKCVGVRPGDPVLSNVFTFTAVPSAIVHAGATPVYVNCTPGYVLDVADLERKMRASGAKFLVVSHMRGKVSDMDRIAALCEAHGVTLVEDCAHSLAVTYKGRHTGHHGKAACFSSQSYKMLNSGEGGFLVTNDDEVAARAILYAGSYEKLYAKHLLAPPAAVFEALKATVPNFSTRMHAVTAAMIRPQIATLDERKATYNRRYRRVAAALDAHPHVSVPRQLPEVGICGDSVQFNLGGVSPAQVRAFVAESAALGVPVEVFGAADNARNFVNWRFAEVAADCDASLAIIQYAVDLRLPLLFEEEDFDTMVDVVLYSLDRALAAAPAAPEKSR